MSKTTSFKQSIVSLALLLDRLRNRSTGFSEFGLSITVREGQWVVAFNGAMLDETPLELVGGAGWSFAEAWIEAAEALAVELEKDSAQSNVVDYLRLATLHGEQVSDPVPTNAVEAVNELD